MKNPTVDDAYIKAVMGQLAHASPEEFEALAVDVPTAAADGETVAVLLTGVAKGGRLTNAYGTEFQVEAPERKPGLKSKLSDTKSSDKEDGESQEE